MYRPNDIIKKIKELKISFIDLRFTDTKGKEHHITIPKNIINEIFFTEGKVFDGSSILGWKNVSQSDMLLIPDLETVIEDPFSSEKTLNIRCNIFDPITKLPYKKDPRSIAQCAEDYLKSTNIADTVYFGPEPEFFIFDDIRWKVGINESYYKISSKEAIWNSGKKYKEGNMGHRPHIKGGYFPVPPIDSSHNIRSVMCKIMMKMGIEIEAHHHEVATANQNEIATKFNSLKKKADEIQIIKYIVQNVANMYGKSATFMPKPLIGDNGSGMHCHQSLFKNGKNIFSGNYYSGLSKKALYYIGGIIEHAKAINAFTNASTNSYKRLIPGFEAPVLLGYSAGNRSASIRIPYTQNAKSRRIEIRFPDASGNPYLGFSAMMMAGIDGIINKIFPGDPIEKDFYNIKNNEFHKIPRVASSLKEALIALKNDSDFLKIGNVFNNDIIDSYIKLKTDELESLEMTTHPLEFKMYYSC